jgi:hypothetical protein
MPRPLAPRGGNDNVNTPDELAARIVAHFQPEGRILEPCRGGGAFTRAMPGCDWCELAEGRDFLSAEGEWDWVVTNPPWSQLRPFLKKAMRVSDHVVFLSLINAFWMRARLADVKAEGFGFVELLMLDTPPLPWPQTGFQLGATYLRRGYAGPTKLTWQP